MARANPRPASLTRPLPFVPELALACTAFFSWLLANCVHVRIGTSLEVLRIAVADPQWHPQWPLGPWLVGVAALVLAFVHHRRNRLSAEAQAALCNRLRQLSLLTGALLLLRLGLLLIPLSAPFPYLGLLWPPHATWALAAALLIYLQGPLLPALKVRTMAWSLLSCCAVGYSCWCLYFCQTTMLHGDEAHYLRVTQSLLHDGDMDLSNNLGAAASSEFHLIDFQTHRAPGSPPGRIHSVHPIGLSAMVLPAYWAGLHLWANPRLAASLLMALLSAAVVTLLFLWLVRLGFAPWVSLACVLVAATTTPLLIFSNQLYPEVPALLISLVFLVALAHLQLPDSGYRALGTREPQILAGLLALLLALLFLHPRYLPLALFLGAGLYLQVRRSPDPRAYWRLLAPIAGAGALGLIAFNYSYSSDLFGPFLPGNAWEKGALQGSTWLLSLPGHWLHRTSGLLNSSPVFLASGLGLLVLARRPGALRWGALVFYLATAGVNGLHPDWTFGFCPPARYLLTALPVLLRGMALFTQRYGGRLPVLYGLLLALSLAHDSVLTLAALPEEAFGGHHLPVRLLNEYYPLDMHFFSQTSGDLPWDQLGFWLLFSGALAAAALHLLTPRWRWAALGAAALLPFGWGQTGAYAAHLRSSAPPYLAQLDASGAMPSGVRYFDFQITSEYQKTTGLTLEAGGYEAQAPGDPAGILRSFYAPLIQPGVHTYTLSGVQAEHPAGQVAGHFTIAQRRVLPAVADWGIYHTQPIAKGPAPTSEVRQTFTNDQMGLAYAYVEFSGAGALAFEKISGRFLPLRLQAPMEEMGRYGGASTQDQRSTLKVGCGQLPRGYYLARYHLEGMAFGAFFKRKPASVYMAVYTDQYTPPGGPSLETQATRWLSEYYPVQNPTVRPDLIRPLVERKQAPWWTAVPVLGADAYELAFALPSAGEVWLLLDYDGDAGIEAEGVSLYRMDLASATLTE